AMSICVLDNNSSNLKIQNCNLLQNYAINESNWSAVGSRYGIVNIATAPLYDIEISECTFFNLADAISGENNAGSQTEFINLIVDNCRIDSCGRGLYFEKINSSSITNNIINNIKFSHIKIGLTSDNIVIDHNIFSKQSSTSSSLVMLQNAGAQNLL